MEFHDVTQLVFFLLLCALSAFHIIIIIIHNEY